MIKENKISIDLMNIDLLIQSISPVFPENSLPHFHQSAQLLLPFSTRKLQLGLEPAT
jgi:hypothetical protein